MTCAKTKVVCVITAPDGEQFVGENYCRNPQPVCPRLPGEGYEKCKTICDQAGHAEAVALSLAGEKARGAVAQVRGHSYYCADCQHKLFAAGISALTPPSLCDYHNATFTI